MLTARLGHALQTSQLPSRLLLDFGRHPRLLDRLFELTHVRRAALVLLAQLATDLAQLFAQDRLFLSLGECFARLLSDVARELQDFDALIEQGDNPIEPCSQIVGLQDLLFLGRLDVHDAHDQVGEQAGRLHGLDAREKLCGRLGQELQRLDGAIAQIERARFNLAAHRLRVRPQRHTRLQKGLCAHELAHLEALLALRDQVMHPVGRSHETCDVRRGAGCEQILRTRIIDAGSFSSRKPIFARVRTASCAAAVERGRLTATGSTMPGSITCPAPAK